MSSFTGVSSTSATLLTPRPVIFVVGDSLTQHASDTRDAGWVALMLHRYNRSADVLPRGLSGYNTKYTRLISSRICRDLTALLLVSTSLWTRTRKAWPPSSSDSTVVLQTPTLLNTPARRALSSDGRAERTNAAVGEYARACVETGAQRSVPVLDLYSFFNAVPEPDRAACLDDGLHFSERGSCLVDEQLQKKIDECFPDVAKRLKSWQLPDFHIWMDE